MVKIRQDKHATFHYHNWQEIKSETESLGFSLPYANTDEILRERLNLGGKIIENRLGIAPMEGADAALDGSPSDYTIRRYLRYAQGGTALIWFEAISIVEEGRSSSGQLFLSEKNLDMYKQLIEQIKETGMKANGFAPYLVMQATHSGRYANPENRPGPMISGHNPLLERQGSIAEDRIVTDDYLKMLEEKYGEISRLAKNVGFDAVDIKSCHGYLTAELTAAYQRPGFYGGSYENRTRFLRNSIKSAQIWADENFQITTRLGIYDGLPYPYGFGVSAESGNEPDYSEPIQLVRELTDEGISFVNLTMGNPYVTTHITRPFDKGRYLPDEHPLTGVHRMISGISTIKSAVPEMIIYGSAPSYLRQFADRYVAGAVESELCDGFLFGRLAFADPFFAKDILLYGQMDPHRVCLTCGKCGDLIRSHFPTGCVVRNTQEYLPFYQEYQKKILEKL